MSRFVTLNSPACTAILEVSDHAAPLWRYWGPRLADGTLPAAPIRDGRPEPTFSLQFDQPLALVAGLGLGWFGEPTLRAHRAGHDWAHAITACRVEQDGAGRAIFDLVDDVARISARITLDLDPGTDVLTLRTALSNDGDDVLDIAWLAAGTVPLPGDARQVRSYGGRHNCEFVPVDDVLGRSQWRRENRRGLTSHSVFPGAVVTCADGTAYGAQLGWSGNHVQMIEWIDDGRWHWQMGEGLAPGELRLLPGQTVETPDMLATCSAKGANGVAWNFHRGIRARMDWPGGAMSPRPVHINTWEGFYFDHELEALKALADSAADIGVERFVLDDGWFHGRHSDRAGLGDWWADAGKYPLGLAPLARHVVARGMSFGLWVEPEMINPDSELYRAHPDWALGIAGRAQITARNQLVLDMANPAVGDYLFDRIAALLDDVPISYLKWDHNRDLTAAGATPRYREQVRATYALMARLRAAFPHVEIEACAGGGGRIDAGIVRHTHRFWTSDNLDAVSRVGIQRGFLQFMPPELMGSHVGASPAHGTGRRQAMRFRTAVALPGHFGVELDVRHLDARDRERLRDGIADYKALRDLVHAGQTWLGEAADGLVWQAHGSSHDLVLQLTRTSPPTLAFPPSVRVPMVDPARQYRVTIGAAEPCEISGAWLAGQGFAAPTMRAEMAVLVRLTAI